MEINLHFHKFDEESYQCHCTVVFLSVFCLFQEVKQGFQLQSIFESDLNLIITCCLEFPLWLVEHLVVTFKNVNILFFPCSAERRFTMSFSVPLFTICLLSVDFLLTLKGTIPTKELG